jgi:hypothetical protein
MRKKSRGDFRMNSGKKDPPVTKRAAHKPHLSSFLPVPNTMKNFEPLKRSFVVCKVER